MNLQAFAACLLVGAVAAPALAALVIGAAIALVKKPPEHRVHQVCAAAFIAALLASIGLALGLASGQLSPSTVSLGPALALRGYRLDFDLALSPGGAAMLVLDFALCGLVGAFSARYLHQEEGFYRFYIQLLMFSVGIAVIAAADGLDLIFAGWEVVGLSSALLIAFFYERRAPVDNALRAYAVYRMTDVGLLFAVVTLHHLQGGASLSALATAPLGEAERTLLGAAIIFGAMGKGAIVPFTPWLPRALEGPTPSSAIFYGALSVHASPFLLLRISPLLESSLALRLTAAGLGLATALYATLVGRTQSDVKKALGYAAAAQVGLIWVEIAAGLTTLAWVHMLGHSVLRTWQLLRAPSLLHDRHRLMTLKGADLGPTGAHIERRIPPRLRRRLYRWSLERGYLDELLFDKALDLPRRALAALGELDAAWARRFERPDDQGEAR